MADPFTRMRERRAAKKAAAAKRAAAATPVAEYKAVNYINRTWIWPLSLGWAALVFGGAVAMFIYERDIKAVTEYATLIMVLLMVSAICSVGLIFVILLRRRHWRLFGDRLDIEQRPLFWPFGRRIRASLGFDEIKAAHRAELFGGLTVVEIESKSGRAYRLSPGNKGEGRNVHRDNEGFDAFFDQIADTIRASGRELPYGGKLRTLWDTWPGIVILATIIAVMAILALAMIYGAFALGEPRFAFFIFIAYLFGQLAWSMLRTKLRERRHG